MEADIAAKAVELGTNTDFSLFSLFFRADIIVKSVMIILILCSIYSWAQEYIEHNINIIITDLTIMSALKNKLNNEKSVFVPNSTAFAAISASMLTHHT